MYVLVRIKRNTGLSGVLAKIKIYINDKQVAAIKPNQQIELELPADEAKLSVSQIGVRSNELVVKKGQVIEILKPSWWRIIFIVIFIAAFLIGLLSFEYRIYASIILLVVAIAVDYFIKGFELKVVYP